MNKGSFHQKQNILFIEFLIMAETTLLIKNVLTWWCGTVGYLTDNRTTLFNSVHLWIVAIFFYLRAEPDSWLQVGIYDFEFYGRTIYDNYDN